MAKIYKIFIFIWLLTASTSLLSQDIIDSLQNRLPKVEGEEKIQTLNLLAKKLSSRDPETSLNYANEAVELSKDLKYDKGTADGLHYVATYYRRTSQFDVALKTYQQSLEIRLEIQDTAEIARSYNNIGQVYYNLNEYEKAIENYELAREIKQQIGDKKGEGISLNNMGNAYNSLGNYKEAIKMYQEALKIFEEIGLAPGVSSCLNNIGLIYQNMSNISDTINKNKALEHFFLALEMNKELNNKGEIGVAANNIGNLYSYYSSYYDKQKSKTTDEVIIDSLDVLYKENIDKALEYYELSLQNREEINDLPGIASCLNNIGSAYNAKKEYDKAKEYFAKSLKISKEINNQYEVAVNYYNLSQCYLELKDYPQALAYSERSLEISKQINNPRLILSTFLQISKVYEGQGNFKRSLENYKLYQRVNDSVMNVENSKFVDELQTKYETEKKDAQLLIQETEIAKEKAEKEAEQDKNKKQRIIIILAVGGLIVFVILTFFLFRLFRQKKKANIELEHKNELITEQKQEIMDSIHYAKRIQTAILPPGDYVQKVLPHRFILFKPRDIVSGDFFWLKQIERSDVVIATAADCTGHGVPGAFMSMLGVAFLNEIVSRPDIVHPNIVLNHLRENVITSLHQTGKFGEAQDGMDIALIAYYPKKKRLEFSGANNPLYVIRKDATLLVNGEETKPVLEHNNLNLFEVKGDKMPIGIHTRVNESFTNHDVELKEDDRLYIFSDGYPDQFGGNQAKKFKYKPFKKLLMETYDKTMEEQREILDDTLEKWRGDLDQVDDIIIMGIKV